MECLLFQKGIYFFKEYFAFLLLYGRLHTGIPSLMFLHSFISILIESSASFVRLKLRGYV